MRSSSKPLVPEYRSFNELLSSMNQDSGNREINASVSQILQDVRDKGDEAVLQYTMQFDGVQREAIAVSQEEWDQVQSLDNDWEDLFQRAAENIRRFHDEELKQLDDWKISSGGASVGQRRIPVQRVGLYVPGGTAPYPSSVLMNVVPAQVAGVPEIVIVSPPDSKTGKCHPLILAAARQLGIREVYAMGGAQAVAALAYGTETIRPVDKITGPGNRYVTEAKRQVFGRVGIDSLAGPSEIVILADQSANPIFLAADMLSQAEHDMLARSFLISQDQQILESTVTELERQIRTLPRVDMAREALSHCGGVVYVESLAEGIRTVNLLAPEHLELQVEDPQRILPEIRHAGAIFIGPYTPEPVGDYWAGTNHVLPTSANARFASALSVRDFCRWISVVQYDRARLETEAEDIIRFARLEGLEAHARAVGCRVGRGRYDDR